MQRGADIVFHAGLSHYPFSYRNDWVATKTAVVFVRTLDLQNRVYEMLPFYPESPIWFTEFPSVKVNYAYDIEHVGWHNDAQYEKVPLPPARCYKPSNSIWALFQKSFVYSSLLNFIQVVAFFMGGFPGLVMAALVTWGVYWLLGAVMATFWARRQVRRKIKKLGPEEALRVRSLENESYGLMDFVHKALQATVGIALLNSAISGIVVPQALKDITWAKTNFLRPTAPAHCTSTSSCCRGANSPHGLRTFWNGCLCNCHNVKKPNTTAPRLPVLGEPVSEDYSLKSPPPTLESLIPDDPLLTEESVDKIAAAADAVEARLEIATNGVDMLHVIDDEDKPLWRKCTFFARESCQIIKENKGKLLKLFSGAVIFAAIVVGVSCLIFFWPAIMNWFGLKWKKVKDATTKKNKAVVVPTDETKIPEADMDVKGHILITDTFLCQAFMMELLTNDNKNPLFIAFQMESKPNITQAQIDEFITGIRAKYDSEPDVDKEKVEAHIENFKKVVQSAVDRESNKLPDLEVVLPKKQSTPTATVSPFDYDDLVWKPNKLDPNEDLRSSLEDALSRLSDLESANVVDETKRGKNKGGRGTKRGVAVTQKRRQANGDDGGPTGNMAKNAKSWSNGMTKQEYKARMVNPDDANDYRITRREQQQNDALDRQAGKSSNSTPNYYKGPTGGSYKDALSRNESRKTKKVSAAAAAEPEVEKPQNETKTRIEVPKGKCPMCEGNHYLNKCPENKDNKWRLFVNTGTQPILPGTFIRSIGDNRYLFHVEHFARKNKTLTKVSESILDDSPFIDVDAIADFPVSLSDGTKQSHQDNGVPAGNFLVTAYHCVKPNKTFFDSKKEQYVLLNPKSGGNTQKVWIEDDLALYVKPPELRAPNLPKVAITLDQVGPGKEISTVILAGVCNGKLRFSTGAITSAHYRTGSNKSIELHYRSSTDYSFSGAGIFHPISHQFIGIHQGRVGNTGVNRGHLFNAEQLAFLKSPLPKN